MPAGTFAFRSNDFSSLKLFFRRSFPLGLIDPQNHSSFVASSLQGEVVRGVCTGRDVSNSSIPNILSRVEVLAILALCTSTPLKQPLLHLACGVGGWDHLQHSLLELKSLLSLKMFCWYGELGGGQEWPLEWSTSEMGVFLEGFAERDAGLCEEKVICLEAP